MTSTTTTATTTTAAAAPRVRVAHVQGLELVRVVQALRRSYVGEQVRLMNERADLVHLGAPIGGWVVFHPRALERILAENAANYTKSQNYSELAPVMGQGLVTSSGATWTTSRKPVGQELSRQAARVAGRDFARFLVAGVDGWADEGVVDVAQRLTEVAFRFMATALLGPAAAPHCAFVHERLGVWERRFVRRVYSLAKLPDSWPTPDAVRSRRGIAEVDALVDGLITDCLQAPPPPDAPPEAPPDARAPTAGARAEVGVRFGIVDKLVAAWTDEHGVVDRRQVRDEVMTLLLAGHDTTAAALAWTLYLLARHPVVQEQVREEACAAADASTTEALPFLRQVIDESLRLYPPVPGFSRMAIGDDVVCGVDVAAGAKLELSAYATHRHPAFWSEPERFDPARFAPERSVDPFAYVPFGKGPRTCVGKELGAQQLVLGVAALVRQLRFALTTDVPPEPFATITLKPKGGLRLRVERVQPVKQQARAQP